MPSLRSRNVLVPCGWSHSGWPGAWPALSLTVFLPVFLSAVLVMGACSIKREVLSNDRKNRFKAVLLTGTPVPVTPPSPQFNTLSEGEVGRSLRRMTVRVSKFIKFNRGDPTPFHTPAQIDWAKKVMVERIPRLNPDQRLQLHYRDQFHEFLVEVEIWAEGNHLVYYFTKLSARDEAQLAENLGDRPANWVILVEQPGQSLSFDDLAYILKDQLFSASGKKVRERKEKLNAIQAALAKEIIELNESRALSRLMEEDPRVSLLDFKTYLDKRETLKKAFTQNLLNREEFETRRDRLKKTMFQ